MINYFILALIYLFVFLVGRGSYLAYIQIKNKNANLVNERDNVFCLPLFSFYPIIGLFVIGNITIIINFFAPIKTGVNLIIYVILIFLNFSKNTLFKLNFPEYFLIFITLPILSMSSYNTGLAYDAGLYHLNFQNWIREEKIVIGISNLYPRFGYSSIYDYINSNFWFNDNFVYLHYINLIFISFFFIGLHYIFINSNFLKVKIGVISILLYGILDNFGYLGGKNGFIEIESITKFDTPFGILFFLTILFTSFVYSNKSINFNEQLIILIFAIFSFQLRITGILLIFPLCYILFLNKFEALKKNLFLVYLSILFFIKNLISTGCIYFPIEITCSKNLFWYEKGFANLEQETISNGLIAFSRDTSLFEWYQLWSGRFPFNYSTLLNFIYSFLFINLIVLLSVKKNRIRSLDIYYFIFNLFLLFFWLVSAPNFRFGIGIFISIIYFGIFNNVKELKFKLILNEKIFLILLTSCIILLPRVENYKKFVNNPFEMTEINVPIVEYQNKLNGYGVSPLDGSEICMINKFCSPEYIYFSNLKQYKFGYKFFELSNFVD